MNNPKGTAPGFNAGYYWTIRCSNPECAQHLKVAETDAASSTRPASDQLPKEPLRCFICATKTQAQERALIFLKVGHPEDRR